MTASQNRYNNMTAHTLLLFIFYICPFYQRSPLCVCPLTDIDVINKVGAQSKDTLV